MTQGRHADQREKSAALLAAIKEYDSNKWKVIGQKVGKPAKVGLRCISCTPPVLWRVLQLTGTRRASSMRRSTSVGRVERFMNTVLHLSGFSAPGSPL